MEQAGERRIRPTRIVYVFAIVGMSLWTLLEFTAAQIGGAVPLIEVVWFRYVFHILFMLVVFAPRHARTMVATQRPLLQWTRPLLMIGMPVSYILGEHYVSGADLLSAFWISPLMILGLSAVVLRAPVHRTLLVATCLAYLGVCLILRPGRGILDPGTLFSLSMGFCFGFYVVLTRPLARTDHVLANMFYTAFVVLVFLTPVMPKFFVMPSLPHLGILAMVGLMGWIFLYLLDRTLDSNPPTILAPFLLVEPIYLMILGCVLSGSLPGITAVAGATLILGSLAWIGWRGILAPPDAVPSGDSISAGNLALGGASSADSR